MNALEKAISVAGSQEKLGNCIGVSQQRISYWLGKKKIPAEYVILIEEHTGISRDELRPDLYPKNTRQEFQPNHR
nr:MAG TPA: Putative antitoxin of bacterial toxin-antitoxin system, YdaS/YdaT [Caudoviricetes sp.]